MSLFRNASATIAAACLILASYTSQAQGPARGFAQPPPPVSSPKADKETDKDTDEETTPAEKDSARKTGAGANIAWKPAVEPKPLSKDARKGLDWLVAHQLASGGWGQGDESPQMRGASRAAPGGISRAAPRGASQVAAQGTANVADTSMAVLALMRSGSTAAAGAYRKPIYRGIDYILSEIEQSDADSLYVTSVRGTRVQGKIGTYVDTFSSLMVLTEAKGQMPSKATNQRLERALAKVLRKIEKNQQQDGTWANQGWAPVLTQSMAAKGLNRAAQAGAPVEESVLERVEAQARGQFDDRTGSFAGGGSAGVDLYAGAANSATLRDSVNTRKTKERDLRRRAAEGKSERERAAARAEIAENRDAEKATESAEKALLAKLEDPAFIQGFGNNGGEEFLSYMLVSEALVAKGGKDWKRWDKHISQLIARVQNGDGSWTGHHCITGRTFCTAAALLVLMADRTPVPTASKLRGA